MNNEAIPSLTLCIDAAFNSGRFAITTIDGQPVWFGRFFENDGHISNSATAEKVAAMKAVWLAGKVREAIGATRLHLRLLTDAQWLTMPLGQAKELHESAAFRGLEFRPAWIAGKSNPADQFTRCSGFQKAEIEVVCELVTTTPMALIKEEESAEEERKEADCHKDSTNSRPFKNALHIAQAAVNAAKFAAAGITPQQENEWLKMHLEQWNAQKAQMKADGKVKAEINQTRSTLVKTWVEAGKPQQVLT